MVNEYIFFGVGSISLVISLILLSRFIAFWWSLLMLELKMQKISEEQKLLREQNTQEEKDFDENQRAQTEKWKKELESPGMKSD